MRLTSDNQKKRIDLLNMGTCDRKKRVRFAVFPYVVEIPPRGLDWDDIEEGFFSGEEEESEEDFVEAVKGNPVFLTGLIRSVENCHFWTWFEQMRVLVLSIKLWFCNCHCKRYHYLNVFQLGFGNLIF